MNIFSNLKTRFLQAGEALETVAETQIQNFQTKKIDEAAKETNPFSRANLVSQARTIGNVAEVLPKAPRTVVNTFEAIGRSLSEKESQVLFKESLKAGSLLTVSAVQSVFGVGAKKVGLNQISQKLHEASQENAAGAKAIQEVNRIFNDKLKITDAKKFREKIQDPLFIAEGLGMNLPNMLAAMGAAAPAAIAGAPTAVIGTIGFLGAGIIEGGFAYNEAREAGATEEQAEKALALTGVINGILETIPITRLLNKLGPSGQAVKRKIFGKITKDIIIQSTLEAGTESLQEIVTNAVANIYDENRELFANVPEAGFFGGLMGGGSEVVVGQVGGRTLDAMRKGEFGLSIKDISQDNIFKQDDSSLFEEARNYPTAEEYVKAQTDISKPIEPTFTNAKVSLDKIKSLGTKGSYNPTSYEYSLNQLKSGKPVEPIEVVLENGKYRITDGEHRFKAYKELGIKEIPVKIEGDPLTKSQLTSIWEKAQKGSGIEKQTEDGVPTDPADIRQSAEENQLMIDALQEAIDNNPANRLWKYANKKTGELPEMTGEKGRGIFRQFGDAKLSELYGYDVDESKVLKDFEEIRKLRAQIARLQADQKQTRKVSVASLLIREITAVRKDIERRFARSKVQQFKDEFRQTERNKTERKIDKVNTAKDILDSRRVKLKAARDFFHLTDQDLRKIANRDIRFMSNWEFKKYLDDIYARATEFAEKRQHKNEVLFLIREKELQKAENLREFLELPTLDRMTSEQLIKFNEALMPFQQGDEFLSLRKLQTVDNTELKGIRTVREAREVLAKKLNVPLSSVENIDVSPLDKFLFDTALAEKNPFYKFLVDETNVSLLEADETFYNMEKEVDELTKKARQSKERTLKDRLIPTDEKVFAWLEATDKESVAKDMTIEELDLAGYLQARFAQFRDYLVQHKTLDRYQTNYITHIRRGFLEAWKGDGLVTALREVFDQQKQDEAVFNILEDDTQNILPLEKFFKFAMHRSGELIPSQNVSKAFKAYTKAMLKKQALDKIVPAFDIYTYALSPKQITPTGLQIDRRLKKFVNEWVNNKKGRRSSLGGIMPQNGVVDMGLRAINAFVTLIDLGLNIPVGLTVSVGEEVTTFVNLGTKKYALGLSRLATSKGKKIVSDNQAFVGKSIWSELSNTADDIGDKFDKGLYILFDIANTTANKVHLLGSLTQEEWSSGKISNERLALLKREMGRFRNVSGSKSIFGSTSLGSTLTKYKTWALPIFNTVIGDIKTLSHMVRRGQFSTIAKTREFNELLRATLTTTLMVVAIGAVVDEDDDSFLGQILKKAYRDSLTMLGALDPTVLSQVRLLGFLEDLSIALKQIVLLETYKTREGLKGVEKLKRTLTPRTIEQIFRQSEPASKSNNPFRAVSSASNPFR